MSVLIKGMEMPQICEVCPLVDRFVTVDFKTITCKVTKKLRPDSCLTRPDSCPLIEVPPHGRLIDADALMGSLSTLLRFPSNLVNGQWIVNMIREQPTIIEAEEGE